MKKHVFILSLFVIVFAACSFHRGKERRNVVVPLKVHRKYESRCDELGLEAMVSRAFTSSMEVYIDVWVEDPENGNRVKSNEAIYTFVALNKAEEPVEVPQVIPETPLEIERYQGALRRKQLSLVLAGRLKPHDASELQDFFQDLEHQ